LVLNYNNKSEPHGGKKEAGVSDLMKVGGEDLNIFSSSKRVLISWSGVVGLVSLSTPSVRG